MMDSHGGEAMGRGILIWSAMIGAWLTASTGGAATKVWVGRDGGAFGTAANWNPGGAPGPGDIAVFSNGYVPGSYDINADVDATASQLIIGTTPLSFAGPGRLTLTSTSSGTPSSRALVVGSTSSGIGSVQLSSSLPQLNTPSATIGAEAGTNGTLNVTAGTFYVTGTTAVDDLLIGDHGTGTINVTAGADVTITGDTYLATFAGAVGNISVTGSGSTWTSTGNVQWGKGSGTIMVGRGGVLKANSLRAIGNGTLRGDGALVANVQHIGIVSPGISLGTLQIIGTFTQEAGDLLQIDLGGHTASMYDRLSVSGAVTLGGTLNVTASSLEMIANDVFDILDFGSVRGTFATINMPALGSSLAWDLSRLYVDGTIAVVLPGDFNRSGTVDAADYVAWRNGLGATYVANDYNVWRAHWGASAATAAAAAAPEPSLVVLLFAGISIGSWCRSAKKGLGRHDA